MAICICVVGALFKINDEIITSQVVDDTESSNSEVAEACRLKMSFIDWELTPIKNREYTSDISWLHLEKPLPLVYVVSEDRKAYLLTCLASHHEVGDVALYPVITESGRGLVEAPPELKAPFSDYESISLREFLGIPRSTGRHAVHTIGNFHVLAVNLDDKDDEVVAMVLNPDSDLKRFYQVLPLGLVLSEEDRATIVSEYKVEDPFVLERLSAAWNPYAAPPPRTEAR